MADTTFSGDYLYDRQILGARNRLQAKQQQYGSFDNQGNFTPGTEQALTDYRYGYGDAGAANPYSQLNMFNRQAEANATDQFNSTAEQGNLRSGGGQKRAADLNFLQNKGRHDLGIAYQDAQTANRQQALAAQYDYNDAQTNAYSDALGRKIDSTTGAIEGPDKAKSPAGEAPAKGSGKKKEARNWAIKPEEEKSWAGAKKIYSHGRWDNMWNADGSRYYRSPDGTLYKIWPNGYREVKK